MADNMQAVPRNYPLGLFSDGIGAVNGYLQGGDIGSYVADAASLPQMQRTLDRMSYGESLGTGKGQAWQPRPDTTDTALSLTSLLPPHRLGSASGLLSGAPHTLDSVLQGIYNRLGSIVNK